MAGSPIDVTGIGNAIVDVLCHADDALLLRNGLTKGTMALIDERQAAELYAGMGPAVEVSGGSAANTVAGVASLGGKAAYIGKVHDDQLGEVFSHDLRALGVTFETTRGKHGPPTARCLVLVTEDAQRTMSTFLGACRELGPEDIDEALIRRSQVTYLEGYLWDPAGAKEAFLKASRIAEKAGRKVALSLSDPFCVERHRKELLELVDQHVDILFANEHEICALYEAPHLEDAIAAVRGRCEVAALTLSDKGSVVLVGHDTIAVEAAPVATVVDTTGAGDLYAAGFLRGYTMGMSPLECGQLGALCAAEIISHFGARPARPLRDLV
ncbi:MAG: adenosine kinase [Polyangiales bacterium]